MIHQNVFSVPLHAHFAMSLADGQHVAAFFHRTAALPLLNHVDKRASEMCPPPPPRTALSMKPILSMHFTNSIYLPVYVNLPFFKTHVYVYMYVHNRFRSLAMAGTVRHNLNLSLGLGMSQGFAPALTIRRRLR